MANAWGLACHEGTRLFGYLGEQQGEDGEYFLYGDLIDSTGFVLSSGVWVWSMEWECDSY